MDSCPERDPLWIPLRLTSLRTKGSDVTVQESLALCGYIEVFHKRGRSAY